jgi:hypothetical protein
MYYTSQLGDWIVEDTVAKRETECASRVLDLSAIRDWSDEDYLSTNAAYVPSAKVDSSSQLRSLFLSCQHETPFKASITVHIMHSPSLSSCYKFGRTPIRAMYLTWGLCWENNPICGDNFNSKCNHIVTSLKTLHYSDDPCREEETSRLLR